MIWGGRYGIRLGNDDAVNEQINSTIEDAIARVGVKFRVAKACMNVKSAVPLPAGPSGSHSWRALMHSLSAGKDLQKPAYTGYNRRGSKDSRYVNYNWRDV